MSDPLYILILGTVVLLTLALGIIAVIIFQQRRVFVIQRQNLEKLAESEQRYRRLVKLSPFPLVVTVGGRIQFINDAGMKIFNASSEEELMSRLIHDFIQSDFDRPDQNRIPHMLEMDSDIADVKGQLERLDG